MSGSIVRKQSSPSRPCSQPFLGLYRRGRGPLSSRGQAFSRGGRTPSRCELGLPLDWERELPSGGNGLRCGFAGRNVHSLCSPPRANRTLDAQLVGGRGVGACPVEPLVGGQQLGKVLIDGLEEVLLDVGCETQRARPNVGRAVLGGGSDDRFDLLGLVRDARNNRS